MRPAIVILSLQRGDAERRLKTIAAAIDGDIYGPPIEFPDDLQELFRRRQPIVGIMSAAVLIRCLAPVLVSKFEDPPVVAVSPDGAYAIPLLGAHHGANRLAQRIAAATGGTAAISTATDVLLGVALDDPPEGYSIASLDHYRTFASAVLAGEPVRIVGDAPWLAPLEQDESARLEIVVTERSVESTPERLVIHPHNLAVGVGCERGASFREIRSLIDETLLSHGLDWAAVSSIASIDLKQDELGFERLWSGLRFFSAEELKAESGRVRNPSDYVMGEVGTPSVAEAAALAAAGPDAELIVPKTKGKRATVAIARAPRPIIDQRGRIRGRLFVIGLGPGGQFQRSREATNCLHLSTDWVGYDLYLDLARDAHRGQPLHRFALGEEEARVRHALSLAKQGRQVALLCSGDPGIYAMAALAFEILEREPCRIAVEVIPGISAFQAAAAKAGAMIGHDFCCISLSDLLTPWETIERRIRAAAEGDFVTAFYNPRSQKRRDQIERAMALLAAHRHAETPVVVASSLGREEEKVRIVRLADFDPEEVDMLTLVLVGSSQSRSFTRGDGRTYAFTPRGYARKRAAA